MRPAGIIVYLNETQLHRNCEESCYVRFCDRSRFLAGSSIEPDQ
jgi:hypothetical protein